MNNSSLNNEQIYKIIKIKKNGIYYITAIIKIILLSIIIFILQPILYLSVILAIPYLFLTSGTSKFSNSFKELTIVEILKQKYKEYFKY